MKCQTRKTFVQEMKYSFSIGVRKTFPKKLLIRKTELLYKIVLFHVLMLPLGPLLFIRLEQVIQETKKS